MGRVGVDQNDIRAQNNARSFNIQISVTRRLARGELGDKYQGIYQKIFSNH